jgi:hypothetical protein
MGGTPSPGSVISAALNKQGETIVCEILGYHSGVDKDSHLFGFLDLAGRGKLL